VRLESGSIFSYIPADVTAGWTDGSNGLDTFLQTNFNRPDLVLMLDFGHAADMTRAVYGPDEKRVQAAPGPRCHVRKHAGSRRLVTVLGRLPSGVERPRSGRRGSRAVRGQGYDLHKPDSLFLPWNSRWSLD
jgi:hypothetical protein